MKRIKVLHLTSTPGGIGGVERLLLDLARHWDRSLLDVWHCNLFDEAEGQGVFPRALRETGLPLLEVGGRHWRHLPGIVGKLVSRIRQERFDVVHLHMLHATIIGGFLPPLLAGPKILVTRHYAYRAIPNPALRLLDKLATNRAAAIVAVSNYVCEDAAAHGADRSRTSVIYNGIDLPAFDQAAAGPSPVPLVKRADGPLIGCVGNLSPLKGHEFLLRAMPRVLQRFPLAHLMIVGEGPERDRLTQLAHSLGVQSSVTLAGFQPAVPPLLRQFDVCVQPSVEESFGIVVLEAMAVGKAPIASATGGIPELISDGTTGRLVAPGDSDAIADALCSTLEDEGSRRAMGSAARQRVEELFDIRRTVRAYEQLYGRLQSSGSGAGQADGLAP